MFGMPGFDPKNFDPSKMDPRVVQEISLLLQQLPPDRMMKLQTLMHNMMAGIDVRKELEDFERTLPPGFREKLSACANPTLSACANPTLSACANPTMMASYAGMAAAQTDSPEPGTLTERDARLTILRAVADGRMTPEEAEKLL